MIRCKRLLGLAVLACALAPAAAARAQDVQLEVNVFEGYGISAGVGLTDRIVLLTGARVGMFDEDHGAYQTEYGYWEVPLEMKLYTSTPDAGHVAPVIVLGVSYSRQHWRTLTGARAGGLGGLGGLGGSGADHHSVAFTGLHGRAMIGVDYMIDDVLGVHVSGGLRHGRVWGQAAEPGFERSSWDLIWRAGLVLRP